MPFDIQGVSDECVALMRDKPQGIMAMTYAQAHDNSAVMADQMWPNGGKQFVLFDNPVVRGLSNLLAFVTGTAS